MDYEKLTIATLAIQKGAQHIGTNQISIFRLLVCSREQVLSMLLTALGLSQPLSASLMLSYGKAIEHLGLAREEVVMVVCI